MLGKRCKMASYGATVVGHTFRADVTSAVRRASAQSLQSLHCCLSGIFLGEIWLAEASCTYAVSTVGCDRNRMPLLSKAVKAKCTVMGGQHTHENVHSGRS